MPILAFYLDQSFLIVFGIFYGQLILILLWDIICFLICKYSVLINKYLGFKRYMIICMKSSLNRRYFWKGSSLIHGVIWMRSFLYHLALLWSKSLYIGVIFELKVDFNHSSIKSNLLNQIPDCMDGAIFCSYRMRNFRKDWRSITLSNPKV